MGLKYSETHVENSCSIQGLCPIHRAEVKSLRALVFSERLSLKSATTLVPDNSCGLVVRHRLLSLGLEATDNTFFFFLTSIKLCYIVADLRLGIAVSSEFLPRSSIQSVDVSTSFTLNDVFSS